MAKTDRMFEVIQILRAATRPLRAADIAGQLEVSPRTVYRDIAALQAMRIPIEGEAGIGYVMRRGYDLPPINFDVEEAEALTLGLAMIGRAGDPGLRRAADRAARKLTDAAPRVETLYSSVWGVDTPLHVDLSAIREAIRTETKLDIAYQAPERPRTDRRLWPLALIYYVDNVVLVAWCELRRDFRHFRPDRMLDCRLSAERFTGQGTRLRQQWEAELKGQLLD
ncbi:YafY family transcriptional regulator [Rhodobacteraceae bacterium NNCM2]|nr:YafY family transcriptional regulator [Coraliihabitans acroporae]